MGKPVSSHSKLCAEIAGALGIPHCKMLEIRMAMGELVSVKTEFYPDEDNLRKLIPILGEYELVEKGNRKD